MHVTYTFIRIAISIIHQLPKTDPVIKKSYFQIDTPEGPSVKVSKHAHQLIVPSNNIVLVHYLGDENIARDFVHGNVKHNTESLYVRTCPSVLRNLEKKCIYN